MLPPCCATRTGPCSRSKVARGYAVARLDQHRAETAAATIALPACLHPLLLQSKQIQHAPRLLSSDNLLPAAHGHGHSHCCCCCCCCCCGARPAVRGSLCVWVCKSKGARNLGESSYWRAGRGDVWKAGPVASQSIDRPAERPHTGGCHHGKKTPAFFASLCLRMNEPCRQPTVWNSIHHCIG